MQEALNSIKAFLYERSSSPLAGAFVIAWLIINYRIVLIVFSGDSPDLKFSGIEQYFEELGYLQSWWGWSSAIPVVVWKGVVSPVILTILYLFIYPAVAYPVYKWSLWIQGEMRKLKEAADKDKMLPVKRSQEILTRQAQLEKQIADEREQSQSKNDALTSTVNEFEAIFGGGLDVAKKMADRLEELEQAIETYGEAEERETHAGFVDLDGDDSEDVSQSQMETTDLVENGAQVEPIKDSPPERVDTELQEILDRRPLVDKDIEQLAGILDAAAKYQIDALPADNYRLIDIISPVYLSLLNEDEQEVLIDEFKQKTIRGDYPGLTIGYEIPDGETMFVKGALEETGNDDTRDTEEVAVDVLLSTGLSKDAVAVIRAFETTGQTELTDRTLEDITNYTPIKLKAAMVELKNKNYIESPSVKTSKGTRYMLTDKCLNVLSQQE
ncbi:MAG: hypothetical protein ABJ308_01840 [Halieaceae bacterium]